MAATSALRPTVTPATTSSSALPSVPGPNSSRSRKPAPAPRNVATVPEVGVTEFAIISRSAGTACGSEAPSAARKNRLTPSAPSATA